MRLRRWAVCLFAALLGMATYAVTLGGTYIYDDVAIAHNDARLANPGRWNEIWTQSYWAGIDKEGSTDNLYRPAVTQSFAIQVWLHGDRPALLHAVNILMYGACCALVAGLGRRLWGAAGGWVAGALFAAHPIHAEAVAALVGRAELMAFLGLAGALALHLAGRPSLARSAGILACAALAMLSKETGMLTPAILLAAEPIRRQLVPPAGGKERDDLLLLAAGVSLTLGGYIVLRQVLLGLKFDWDPAFLDPAVQPMVWATGANRVLVPIAMLGRAVEQLVIPGHLSFDYSGRAIGWVARWDDRYLWFGLLAMVAGPMGLAAAIRRHAWGVTLALLGFALTYGATSNLLTLTGINYAERLLFAPSAFVILLLTPAALRLSVPQRTILIGLLVAAGTWRGGWYAAQWREPLRFYEWSARNEPNAVRVKTLLAAEMLERGRLPGAEAVLADQCRVLPEYWDVWLQAAALAEREGRWAEAEADYVRARDLRPALAAGPLSRFNAHVATTRRASSTTQMDQK